MIEIVTEIVFETDDRIADQDPDQEIATVIAIETEIGTVIEIEIAIVVIELQKVMKNKPVMYPQIIQS